MTGRVAPLSPPGLGAEPWRQIRGAIEDVRARVQPFYPRTVTGNITAETSYGFYLVDASVGAVVVTLPKAAAHKGRCFSIKKIDSSSNAVTIDGDGSETIDDGLTATIKKRYTCLTVLSDGAEWWIV